MALWRDDKYLRMVIPHLDRFVQKANHTYNFRCPLCGDSEKNQYKSRGYIFPKGDVLMFKCHNCSLALPFSALLKRLSRQLYKEYILEKLADERQTAQPEPEPVSEPPAKAQERPYSHDPTAGTGIDRLSNLEGLESHPCRSVYRWARDVRKLSFEACKRLYTSDRAHTWIRELVEPEKAVKVQDGIPYLIQPFRLPGEWFGAQLRPVDKKDFVTFRWAREPLKMFGLEAWDSRKLTYIVEGPIDALFVPNAISPCGSDLLQGYTTLETMFPKHGLHDVERVYVWDNEPRNTEVCRHIRNAITMNESVVIWERSGTDKTILKDINDMVRAGKDIETLLRRRTFKGMSAQIAFAAWLGVKVSSIWNVKKR